MPYAFNGCGTSYYGQRDRAEDGSYITTLWVTAVWIPLLPLASYRLRPVGEGTNIIIHRSQSYQGVRVPLCWPQVRNVYLCVSPILVLILYFAGPDIQKWWKEDVVKSNTSQSALEPEPPPTQPFEADLPLDSKDAAVSCGKLLKLDEAGFEKLSLPTRLAQLIESSGFSDEELKHPDVRELVFKAYSFAYLTWENPKQTSRTSFDEMVIKAAHAGNDEKLSPDERAQLDTYLVKFKKLMVKAFDLGRQDAKTSPCPWTS